jgi:hypothetical protein
VPVGKLYCSNLNEVKRMFNADNFIAFFVGILGIVIFWGSMTLQSGYMPGVPGPGFFPRLVSYGLIVLSILLFISGLKSEKTYFEKGFFRSKNFKNLIWILIATTFYVLAWIFEIGTFIINSIIYFSIILYFFGEKRIIYVLALSIGFTFFTFYFFTNILRILL